MPLVPTKVIQFWDVGNLGDTGASVTIHTYTARSTVTGWRLQFHAQCVYDGQARLCWALCRQPAGVTFDPTDLRISGEGTFFDPAVCVIACGTARGSASTTAVVTNTPPVYVDIDTRTMRKFTPGDEIVILLQADHAAAWNINGVLQYINLT